MSFKPVEALRFAQAWVAAWNSRDAARIIEKYAPSIEYHSPLVPLLTDNGNKGLCGHEQFDAYVRALLVRHTGQIRYRLRHVFVGSNSLVIEYHGLNDRLWAETLVLDPDWKITHSYSHNRPRDSD